MKYGVYPEVGEVLDLSDPFLDTWLEREKVKSRKFVVVAVTPANQYSGSKIVIQELDDYAAALMNDGQIISFSTEGGAFEVIKSLGRTNQGILRKIRPNAGRQFIELIRTLVGR